MPFVKRDDSGKIIAVFSSAETPGLEQVDSNDPKLIDFLNDGDTDAAAKKDMVDSDLGLARVLEDLIDLLIEKGTFRFTDLPEAAQQKLLARRGLRKEFAYVETLFGSDEDEEFPGDGENGFL
jgi:F0F1-type ATP synthase delta subunit